MDAKGAFTPWFAPNDAQVEPLDGPSNARLTRPRGKKLASPCGRVAVRRTPLRASAIAGTLPALDSFLCADGGGDAISL